MLKLTLKAIRNLPEDARKRWRTKLKAALAIAIRAETESKTQEDVYCERCDEFHFFLNRCPGDEQE